MYRRKVIYIIAFLLLSNSHILSSQKHPMLKKWMLEDLPLLPIIFAKSEHLQDGPCKEDVRSYLRGLQNGTKWAVQMFDSSSKFPEGILYGYTRHLGNFDECYNLHVDITEEGVDAHKINGRYCLVDIEYRKRDFISTSPKLSASNIDQFDSFWKVVEERKDLHIQRHHLQLALCVPSSCDAKDIETALRIPLEELGASNNIQLQTAVRPVFCQTMEDAPKFTFGAGIYCVVLLFLLSLVILSTWYDYTLSKSGNSMEAVNFGNRNLLLYFSARRNYKSIFNISYTHTGLDCIPFVRLIAFILLVVLHCSLIKFFYNPTINIIDIENMYLLPFSTLITNSNILINSLFALSGLLTAFLLLKDLDRSNNFNFIKTVVNRYMRLTPTYAIIICFYIWIFPLLGSGPLWRNIVEQECTYCSTDWWINLLYINTYVKPTELCMLHSWSISVEFQLFFCSQFVIYAFWSMPRKIGYLFLGILMVIACAIVFVVSYVYNVPPIVQATPSITKIAEIRGFGSYYIKDYMNVTGYLTGIIGGAIIYDLKNSTWRLSKFWSHILMLPLPLALYVILQCWAYKLTLAFNSWNPLEAALHIICTKLIAAFFVCCPIVVLSISNHLDCYYNILISRWIQPLANLAYGIYLVHIIVIMYEYGQTRTAQSFISIFKTIWDTVPFLIFSLLFSLFLTLCIEIPCRNITKQYFSKDTKIVTEESTKKWEKIKSS